MTARTETTGTVTYSWDSRNRLTGVVAPGGYAVTFTYDGDGQRVRRVESSETVNYIWDGRKVLVETDAGNATKALYTFTGHEFGDLVSQKRDGDVSMQVTTTRRLSSNRCGSKQHKSNVAGLKRPVTPRKGSRSGRECLAKSLRLSEH